MSDPTQDNTKDAQKENRLATWCWWILFVVVIVGVGSCFARDAVTSVEDGEEITYGRDLRDYFAESVHFLALEYGIRIDESAVRAMLEDVDVGEDLSGKDAFLFWAATLGDSPSEKADWLRDVILQDGDVPSEEMQKWADKVEAYQKRNR